MAEKWVSRIFAALLVGGIAIAGVSLIAPASSIQRMPTEDALGTPAIGTIKAGRDYDIPDTESTQRLRGEAARAEQPIYDYDLTAPSDATHRIRDGFQLMRSAHAGYRERRPSVDPAKRKRDELVDPETARVYVAQRDAFMNRLQVVVRDEDLSALIEARFSESAEQALVDLTGRGLANMVAQDRELLAAERERGLIARAVRDGLPESERSVRDLALIRDTTQARDEVERMGAALPEMPAKLRASLTHIAMAMVRPTLVLNPVESARRQRDAGERVKPVVIQVKRGEKIIGDGERIEKRHLIIFNAIRAQTRGVDVVKVRLGGGLLLAILVMLLWRFGSENVRVFKPSRKDAVLLASLLVGGLGLGAAGFAVGDVLHDRFQIIPAESFYYLIPFAAGAMLVRCVLAAEAALLFSIASGISIGLLAGNSVFFAIYVALTSMMAADRVRVAKDRGGFFKAGATVGLLGAMLVVATHLFTGQGFTSDLVVHVIAAFVGAALFMPIAVSGMLPIVEVIFGYVTDVKLLELANLNHPALKELIVQAPGTYHHSIIMGTLVEAAAESIGANPLLAKVSAYYHDIGKTRNPLYFSENQRGENKHDALLPSMSALIIKRHVTDGVEVARHYRLPKIVSDSIPQHHGTRLVGYFWAMAQKAPVAASAASSGQGPTEPLDESHFRYPGPKPQTREAALVMIADTCEASSRALVEPTTDKLRATVQKRINEVFSEGQLDECELTLKDLNAISAVFVRTLDALYHKRPEYPIKPSQPPAERAATVHVLVSK